ncbi:MAG: EAL domain-containing protein [Sideroxydans sp.]
MKQILKWFLSRSLRSSADEQNDGYKILFLNSLFLLAGIVAFGMAFIRWQASATMGMIEFGFSGLSFALLAYLHWHPEEVERLSSIALVLAFGLFLALYVLAPYSTMRLSLFFLLSAAAFLLKGRKTGRIWLFISLFTIVAVHFLPHIQTGYSHLDILATCLYLIGFFLIFENYETLKESQHARESEQRVSRLTEERWEQALEGAGDAVWDWKPQTGEFHYSRRFAEMLGYADGELKSHQEQIFKLVHPEDEPRVRGELQTYLTQEAGHYVSEIRMAGKDGGWKWLLCRGMVTRRDDTGTPSLVVGTFSDITDRKWAEVELQRSRQELDSEKMFFQAILDNAPLGIWFLGLDGRLQFVNKTFCDAVGIPEQRFLDAHHYIDLLPQRVAANCMRSDAECMAQDGPHLSTEWLPFADGKDHLLEITKVKVLHKDGSPRGLIGLAADVTERKRDEDRLRLTAKVFENTLEGITIADIDGNILEVNEAFTRITGYSRDELIGKNPRILQSGRQDSSFYKAMWKSIVENGHWRGEVWNRKKDGELIAEILTISSITDAEGTVTNYVGISSDITLLKQHEKQLEHIAHYDALTNVPNRVLLADRMRQALAYSKREGTLLAVCYLDLDGFKLVNDTMGHEAGDKVLIEVTQRIREAIRDDDTVARLGGDEFVVLLLGLRAPEECTASLNRLLEATSHPIDIKGRQFEISASIGVSLYPGDDYDPDTLMRHADQAMYTAKQSGKNRYHLYDAANDLRARSHHEFLRRLDLAMLRREFELYYQPKVDMRSLRLVGAEALIRWHHPERGLLAPADFLDELGGTTLEIELGDWVVATALAQLEAWHQSGLPMELSINISARHLQSADFAWKLKRKMLRHPNVAKGSLQIEVLETAALEDIPRVSDTIERCRKIGVSFALDDFGTGYSSLSYLGQLPVDTLKIDQSFVSDMLQDQGDRAIVQGVIALAKAFGRKIVAEGVETEELFRALLEMGCEYGQGNGIARPMPASELPAWLEKWNNKPFQ